MTVIQNYHIIYRILKILLLPLQKNKTIKQLWKIDVISFLSVQPMKT